MVHRPSGLFCPLECPLAGVPVSSLAPRPGQGSNGRGSGYALGGARFSKLLLRQGGNGKEGREAGDKRERRPFHLRHPGRRLSVEYGAKDRGSHRKGGLRPEGYALV